jgi:RHS repeat-associated protein
MSKARTFLTGGKFRFLKKLTATLLVFSFVFSPLMSVYAQEATDQAPTQSEPTPSTETSPAEPSEQTPVDTTPTAPTEPAAAVEEIPTEETEVPAEEAKPVEEAPVDTQSASLMSGFATNYSGDLTNDITKERLTPQIDNLTGALTYKYQFTLPPGRNGISPDLELNYSSANEANDYIAGYGWTFNIPSIYRLKRKGTDKLYTQDYFASSVSGELTGLNSSDFVAKIEKGDFLKYKRVGTGWEVTDKNGTVYKFGTSAATRQDDSTGTKIFKWMLEEVRDTNNNFIRYEYTKNGRQIYPSAIYYTGNNITDGIFKVEFGTETKPDDQKQYDTGFAVQPTLRVSTVTVKVNNVVTHVYDLDYTAGENANRSLLTSITETGYTEAGVASPLPPTTFQYQDAVDGWTQDTNWEGPLLSVDVNKTRFVDVNKDGWKDLIYLDSSSNGAVYTNTGTGFTLASSWHPYLTPDKTTIADVNGDELPDLVFLDTNPGSNSAIYLNTGTDWTLSTTWTVPNITGDRSHMIDMNGDGKVDILYLDETAGGVYLNTGTGFAWDANWVTNLKSTETQPVDLNGDGLPDLLRIGTSTSSSPGVAYLNTGSGFTAASGWNNDFWTSHVKVADVNGDALPDLVNFDGSTSSISLNTGTGWDVMSATDWPPALGGRLYMVDINGDGLNDILGIGTSEGAYINNGEAFSGVSTTWTHPQYQGGPLMEDINNDGLLDFIYINNVPRVDISNGPKADYLKTITVPQGGATTITYTHQPIFNNNPAHDSTQYDYVVKSVQVNDNNGVTATTSYSYSNGKYYYYSDKHRIFAGFEMVTKTDPAGNVTKTYYHQGDTTNTTVGEYSDNQAKIGLPYRVEEYNSSNNLYRLTVDKWDHYNIGTNHDFAKLVRETVLNYDGDSDHADTTTEFTYDNTNGNQLTKTEYGQVTGSTNGSYTDTGTDKRINTTTYAINATNGVNVPSSVLVTDSAAAKVAESKYYYDTLAFGSVGKGNQTKVEQWKTGTTYINSQKTYNATYGTVATETDPRGKVTSYTNDTYNLYPATVTDPLLHATQYQYDYSAGKAKQITDMNGFIYKFTYDGLDRLLEKLIPGFTMTTTYYPKISYTYTDTAGAMSVNIKYPLDSSVTADEYQYFDGLGRVIQKRKEAETSGSFNVSDTVYNNVGLVQKQSLPYTSSGSAKTSPTATTALYATTTYDSLYRPLTIVDAIGTTTYAYDDWKTTVTDRKSKVKRYYNDAYNNLAKVEEVNGASTYTTLYTWNLNNKLTKITDALSNIRNFTYDGLGRRLTAEDLHASADVTFGTWTYTYDDAGNLTQTVSPRTLTTNYTYNDVNQVLTEDYTGVAGTEITYTYGGCTNGTGKLCTVTMSSGANSAYTYDSNSNIKTETKTINSTAYTTTYTYDRQNLLTVTTPDNALIKYIYNTANLLNQIQWQESGGTLTNIVSNFNYNPADLVTTTTFNNTVTTTNTYDAAKRYRLSRILTQNTVPTKHQDLNFTYDNENNITQIIDASNTNSAKTAVYGYDDLYRMTSATITAVPVGQTTYTHNYTYDAVGNILTSPIGTYTYAGTNYANPHAATSINGVTYTYDNDGNVTANGTLANTWNYKDQLTQAVKGGVTSTYKYDHEGNRVSLANGTTSTVYPNKYYNTDGTKKTKQIYAGDRLVATIETNGATVTPYYVHTDHLLGSNVVTDGSGAKVQLLDYYPYGDVRLDEKAGSFNEQRQYIGQMHDADTDLEYLNARYYKADTGRFMSQDPIHLFVGDELVVSSQTSQSLRTYLSDPQQLNSYSYATNNPITNKDPSGKSTIRAWLVNRELTVMQIAVGKVGELYLNATNRPASAQLFAHSFNIEPGPMQASTGSNIANSIIKSNSYTSQVDDFLVNNPQGGNFNVEFNPSSGDAKTATGKVSLDVTAKPLSNGRYSMSVKGTDVYNFGYDTTDYGNGLGVAANFAFLSQQLEAISPFNVNINFEHTYTPKSEGKKKSAKKK